MPSYVYLLSRLLCHTPVIIIVGAGFYTHTHWWWQILCSFWLLLHCSTIKFAHFYFFVFSFYYFYCLGMCENGAKILLSVTTESERGESISVGGDGDMDCVSHLDIKNYEHWTRFLFQDLRDTYIIKISSTHFVNIIPKLQFCVCTCTYVYVIMYK